MNEIGVNEMSHRSYQSCVRPEIDQPSLTAGACMAKKGWSIGESLFQIQGDAPRIVYDLRAIDKNWHAALSAQLFDQVGIEKPRRPIDDV